MATPAQSSHPGPDHLVTIKVLYNDSNRRFKFPLKDLRQNVLTDKVRLRLHLSSDRTSSPLGIPNLLSKIARITLGDKALSSG